MSSMRPLYDNAQRHEPSPFERGKSMSEQLREEREYIERTAPKRGIVAKKIQEKKSVINPCKFAMLNRQCNIDVFNFIEGYLYPRKLTWAVLARLANQKGLRTQSGKEWTSGNLQQTIERMKENL